MLSQVRSFLVKLKYAIKQNSTLFKIFDALFEPVRFVWGIHEKWTYQLSSYIMMELMWKRKNTFITCTGMTDGMGAQVQAVYSAMAYCKAYQKTYVHSRMYPIDHNIYKDPMKYDPHVEEKWAKEVNDFFSMGLGELQIAEINHMIININHLLGVIKYFLYHFLTTPIVVKKSTFHIHTDRFPDHYQALQESFREKFYSTPKTDYVVNKTKDCIDIALLVRRGDITSDNAQRYTTNEDIVERLTKMKAMFYDMKIPYNLHIYSEGSAEDFGDIPSFGTMHLNGHPFGYVINFVKADILMCARSSFSQISAVLSKNIVIAEPRMDGNMSEWFSYKDDLFEQTDFRNVIKKTFEGKLAKA